MVGPSLEEVINEVRALAKACREERIESIDTVLPKAGVVRLRMHSLALKGVAVQNSTQPQPSKSEAPANPKAIDNKLRFGSGSV